MSRPDAPRVSPKRPQGRQYRRRRMAAHGVAAIVEIERVRRRAVDQRGIQRIGAAGMTEKGRRPAHRAVRPARRAQRPQHRADDIGPAAGEGAADRIEDRHPRGVARDRADLGGGKIRDANRDVVDQHQALSRGDGSCSKGAGPSLDNLRPSAQNCRHLKKTCLHFFQNTANMIEKWAVYSIYEPVSGSLVGRKIKNVDR